jgi:hypothetical protein
MKAIKINSGTSATPDHTMYPKTGWHLDAMLFRDCLDRQISCISNVAVSPLHTASQEIAAGAAPGAPIKEGDFLIALCVSHDNHMHPIRSVRP